MALRVRNIYREIRLMEEQNELKDVAVQSRGVQEIVALIVFHQWICAVRQQ